MVRVRVFVFVRLTLNQQFANKDARVQGPRSVISVTGEKENEDHRESTQTPRTSSQSVYSIKGELWGWISKVKAANNCFYNNQAGSEYSYILYNVGISAGLRHIWASVSSSCCFVWGSSSCWHGGFFSQVWLLWKHGNLPRLSVPAARTVTTCRTPVSPRPPPCLWAEAQQLMQGRLHPDRDQPPFIKCCYGSKKQKKEKKKSKICDKSGISHSLWWRELFVGLQNNDVRKWILQVQSL